MAEQTVAEILRKVQRIQIVANRSVDDLPPGVVKRPRSYETSLLPIVPIEELFLL